MAENETEGGETNEVAAQPKSKFKLIVIIVGALAVLGGGAASYFLFFKSSGDEHHAEAPKAKPPVFVDVPDMLVNLTGNPGERVQYLKVKIVLTAAGQQRLHELGGGLDGPAELSRIEYVIHGCPQCRDGVIEVSTPALLPGDVGLDEG